MKRRNWMKRLLASALMLILVSAFSVSARGLKTSTFTQEKRNAAVDDDLLKALEIAIAKLASAEKVNSLQKEQIDALQGKITALEALVQVHKEIASTYKTAAMERATANTLDDKRIALYESSILDYKENTKRLIAERDGARRANKFWGIAGVALGVFIGSYAKR